MSRALGAGLGEKSDVWRSAEFMHRPISWLVRIWKKLMMNKDEILTCLTDYDYSML